MAWRYSSNCEVFALQASRPEFHVLVPWKRKENTSSKPSMVTRTSNSSMREAETGRFGAYRHPRLAHLVSCKPMMSQMYIHSSWGKMLKLFSGSKCISMHMDVWEHTCAPPWMHPHITFFIIKHLSCVHYAYCYLCCIFQCFPGYQDTFCIRIMLGK